MILYYISFYYKLFSNYLFFFLVDYSYRVYTLNLVTQYFKAVLCFLNYGLLPESIEQDPMQSLIQCDFTHLIQYANKR